MSVYKGDINNTNTKIDKSSLDSTLSEIDKSSLDATPLWKRNLLINNNEYIASNDSNAYNDSTPTY